jgi:hypothetical protein
VRAPLTIVCVGPQHPCLPSAPCASRSPRDAFVPFDARDLYADGPLSLSLIYIDACTGSSLPQAILGGNLAPLLIHVPRRTRFRPHHFDSSRLTSFDTQHHVIVSTQAIFIHQPASTHPKWLDYIGDTLCQHHHSLIFAQRRMNSCVSSRCTFLACCILRRSSSCQSDAILNNFCPSRARSQPSLVRGGMLDSAESQDCGRSTDGKERGDFSTWSGWQLDPHRLMRGEFGNLDDTHGGVHHGTKTGKR